MEDSNIAKHKKNDFRSLLKKSFKNPLLSLVPFEIWRDLIVSNADLKTIVVLSHSCHAFKDLVDDIGKNNFNLALMFRKEDQIRLAKKFLLLCAENNNSTALFHIGYAKFYSGGWGLKKEENGFEWLEKSAELGNAHAMAFFAYILRQRFEKDGAKNREEEEKFQFLAKKALSSKNDYAIGFCYCFGLGVGSDDDKAISYFGVSANSGDEFAQFKFANCLRGINKTNESFEWMLKSAEQGSCVAQYQVAFHFKLNRNDRESYISWLRKSARQGFDHAIAILKSEDPENEKLWSCSSY